MSLERHSFMRQSITAKYDSFLFSEISKTYSLEYVEEDKPLGTAGSLQLIKEEFSQPFIVTNCDILIHADYEDIYRYHKEAGNELTIVTALKISKFRMGLFIPVKTEPSSPWKKSRNFRILLIPACTF